MTAFGETTPKQFTMTPLHNGTLPLGLAQVQVTGDYSTCSGADQSAGDQNQEHHMSITFESMNVLPLLQPDGLRRLVDVGPELTAVFHRLLIAAPARSLGIMNVERIAFVVNFTGAIRQLRHVDLTNVLGAISLMYCVTGRIIGCSTEADDVKPVNMRLCLHAIGSQGMQISQTSKKKYDTTAVDKKSLVCAHRQRAGRGKRRRGEGGQAVRQLATRASPAPCHSRRSCSCCMAHIMA